MKIGFIGAGNMAEAIIKGIISAGTFSASDIYVSDIFDERLNYMQQNYNITALRDNKELISLSKIAVMAVKPQSMDIVFESIAGSFDDSKLLISIAAGIPVVRFTDALGDIPVVRVMPNTPSLVGRGAAGLYANRKAKDKLDTALQIFSAIGEAVVVKSEDDIDTVTALSGSGPAYYFLMMEEMIKAGIELGLDPETAKKLTLQTALGAAELAASADKRGETPEQLRKKVTSPGGTTEAALKVFNEDQFGAIVVLAMEKAKERSKELSGI
ncbi:MAG: pyrroline-5-carboxylate reductase [Sedimentisphaeraceae bacterium JB056]